MLLVMSRFVLVLIFILYSFKNLFSNAIQSELYTYKNIPIVVKLSTTNRDQFLELSKETFDIITNEIYNYSYDTGSYLSRITESAYKKPTTINNDLKRLLGKILYYNSLTRSISPTIGYLIDIWGFEKNEFYVPSPSELSNALKISSTRNLVISDSSIIIRNKKTKLYLSPFASGIALTKVKELLKKNRITNGFISIGNNISLCLGSKDQQGWSVGIMNPQNRVENEVLMTVNVSNLMLYTADVSENAFVSGFKSYHSIIDPRTGYPADNGTISVSVASEDPVEAIILARMFLVMGKSGGMLFAEKFKIKAIFITVENGKRGIYKSSSWVKTFDRDLTKKQN
ncbi:MAG: FAD:protein FMN transferase [Spirochaetia bacterium]|nr:FAD:protein FMN transferase [Spirochaetota bacterium]MCX8096218.1 FAD:protein FMN transferase [Spirochaetota bacterium]MDW8112934.1 FAD:protein FMN transferase [Spirochaetia bacterium]